MKRAKRTISTREVFQREPFFSGMAAWCFFSMLGSMGLMVTWASLPDFPPHNFFALTQAGFSVCFFVLGCLSGGAARYFAERDKQREEEDDNAGL